MSDSRSGVVAFAFGLPSTLLSNECIAMRATFLAKELNAPVYTQFAVPMGSRVDIEREEDVSGRPPSTLRICRGAVRWAMRRGLDELWVVSAPAARWRSMRDLEYAVQEISADIHVWFDTMIYEYPERVWYRRDSLQLHTRYLFVLSVREHILKMMPISLYRRIAN